MKSKLSILKSSIDEDRKRAFSDAIDFQLWSDDEGLNLAAQKLFSEYEESSTRQRAYSKCLAFFSSDFLV